MSRPPQALCPEALAPARAGQLHLAICCQNQVGKEPGGPPGHTPCPHPVTDPTFSWWSDQLLSQAGRPPSGLMALDTRGPSTLLVAMAFSSEELEPCPLAEVVVLWDQDI